ncbi:RelA/SpoT domain-containing protein [Brevundimonas vesicularis]|uniref:RelA/SpoT domain-containing protein n=1 Tax=Brevundimonas vesicularis TaxID=41276 RepID=UPI0028AF1A26|nr:RelA/SpoT domain-containing protein [Brevundimonas vesicularis]
MATKSRLDKAGRSLAEPGGIDEYELLELEEDFDVFRAAHLHPLSEMTIELQNWLAAYGGNYYIAQRLKRKPQIIRKLRRLNTRLTQLQDIGGSRIIVDSDKDVDKLSEYIKARALKSGLFDLKRVTDYRDLGRDDSGYRALHFIVSRGGFGLELQIRSKTQHYWAESIERTSVVYGNHLKEGEGDASVIAYFKILSDIFYEIEAGREPSPRQKTDLDQMRVRSENIIERSDKAGAIGSYVNEDVIKAMIEKEAHEPSGLKNWLIVFDWNSGAFVTWDVVGRSPEEAIAAYVRYEKEFPAEEKYEVVLIGSSDVSTVSQTHSHYFGIADFDDILENLDQSIIGFSRRQEMDVGARQILGVLFRKKFVGAKTVSVETLKNHMCKNVITFDASLKVLLEKEFVISSTGISINIKRLGDVQSHI